MLASCAKICKIQHECAQKQPSSFEEERAIFKVIILKTEDTCLPLLSVSRPWARACDSNNQPLPMGGYASIGCDIPVSDYAWQQKKRGHTSFCDQKSNRNLPVARRAEAWWRRRWSPPKPALETIAVHKGTRLRYFNKQRTGWNCKKRTDSHVLVRGHCTSLEACTLRNDDSSRLGIWSCFRSLNSQCWHNDWHFL